MAVGKKKRFEVFRRDEFTCAYCGKTPPAVVLEVDHMVPRAEGGTDEYENLLTSCFDCNRGKGKTLLDKPRAPHITSGKVAMEQERLDQARAYHDLQLELDELVREQYFFVIREWNRCFCGTSGEDGVMHCDAWFPVERTIRYFLKHLPLSDITDVVRLTADRMLWNEGKSPSLYFYKVCHSKISNLQEAADL